jgi:hypothetical protein
MHDYEVGSDNIAYTWTSGIVQEQIKSMLVQKVDHKEIIRNQSLFSVPPLICVTVLPPFFPLSSLT